MLVATSEVKLATATMRSTIVLERAVRGTVVLREGLAFDTKFAAAVPGKPEPVGHMFLLLAGRFVVDRAVLAAPVGFVLADDEIERVHDRSRTFRTDGERAHVIQLRFDRRHLRVPIGLAEGPLALATGSWDAATALLDGAPRGDTQVLARLLDALAGNQVISGQVAGTLCAEEPERFRRLWSALEPLYQAQGATISIKQVASSLGMSMRQVGRDAKEMTQTFGLGGGYRDTLLMLRLRVAVLLLSARDVTVADVARCIGYGSPIALARAFRDAELPSPSAVQDAMRG